LRRLLHLTHRHRAPSVNLALGVVLAFIAGAINAGGFLLLQRYTSHMTGFASKLADGLALKDTALAWTAAGAICAFTAGAALTAILVHLARQRGARAVYAMPLMLEAALLILFGLVGSQTLLVSNAYGLPGTVLLLSFIMGLQNAVGSKSSRGSIRTTHMTGNVTDLGMELGKLLYRLRGSAAALSVSVDGGRLQRSASLLVAFVTGGTLGALCFQTAGFIFVVPLATVLLALAAAPLVRRSRRSGH